MMDDAHTMIDNACGQYAEATERVLRACGRRYGLDDLEIHVLMCPDLRCRREIWWTREERMVGWCELIARLDGHRLIYTICGGGSSDDGMPVTAL